MTDDQIDRIKRLADVLMPYAANRRQAMIGRNGRFVHYTTAANALSIIQSKRLWMRNANAMADSREVAHGFDQ